MNTTKPFGATTCLTIVRRLLLAMLIVLWTLSVNLSADDAGTGDAAGNDGRPVASAGDTAVASGDASTAAPNVPVKSSPGAPTAAGRSSGAHVVYIPIKSGIDYFTALTFKRAVERAMQATPPPSVIVVEFDTPGGKLNHSVDIARYIKKDIKVETVAWVNSEALSGGILIASACDRIVMSSSSVMGDCAPILMSRFGVIQMGPTERAKALSPLLAEFEDNARKNGYPYWLLHAMCVLGVEVFEVEHAETGKRLYVNRADYEVMVNGKSIDEAKKLVHEKFTDEFSQWVAPANPPSPMPAPLPQPTQPTQPIQPTQPGSQPGAPGSPAQPAGPSPTAWSNRVNPTQQGSFVPGEPSVALATPADRGKWKLVREVHNGKTLATFNQQNALDYGLATEIGIDSEADLEQYLKANSSARYGPTVAEHIANWLVSLPVRAVLVVLFLLGTVIELSSPGMGWPGGIAVLALAALIGAPFFLDLARVWHVLLLVVGLILLMVEVFVLPGFGVAGLSGILCIFIGLVVMVVPSSGQGWFALPAAGTASQLGSSALWILAGLVLSVAGFLLMSRYIGSMPVLSTLVLRDAQHAVTSTETAADGTPLPVKPQNHIAGDESYGGGGVKVGDTGTVTMHLRPSGRVRVGDVDIDAVSEGQWLEPGVGVEVVEVAGNRIVVSKST